VATVNSVGVVTILGVGSAIFTLTQATIYGYTSASTTTTVSVTSTVPDAPTGVSASSGANAQSVISWTAPTNNGGASITSYTITPYISGTAGTSQATGSSSTSYTFTGLTNGTSYTFKVQAENINGLGQASTASNSATPSSQVTPTLGTFTIPTPQTFGNSPFTITPPTSNSPGAFSYTSSNSNVATISSDIATITGVGESIITAIQAETTNYTSVSASATLIVNANSPSDPVQVSNNEQLVYFLNSTATYCTITSDIIVTENLQSSFGTKIIVNNSSQNVKISR